MNDMPLEKNDHRSREELLAENEALRLRLEVAEETMRAIKSGEVDAVVVSGPQGNKIFTLEGAEKRYRTLVETMNEGAATLAPDGRILYCNSFLASILKIPLEKLIGSQLVSHVAPADAQAYASLIEKTPEGTSRGEIRLVTSDGHDLPILLSRSSISQNESHGFTMVLTDLSEQKHSQQTIDALRFSEARYRALFLDNPTMIAMLDAEGTILSANPSCTSQLGYTKEELDGQSGLNLFFEDDRAAVAVELRRCLDNPNQVHHWQFRKIRKNGELLWVEETVQAVYNLNGALNILLVCQDVTELKQAERERELAEEKIKELNVGLAAWTAELDAANKDLEAFNYTVAHDLRNPLNVISMSCQAIIEFYGDQLTEECMNYVQDIYNGVFRMNQLIEALLTFSLMGRIELHREKVFMSVLAHEVAIMLKRNEPERQVDFRIADGITAEADANLMRVVLDNLLGNALKYTGKQEEAVIEFDTTEIDGKQVYFVRDNGAGFDTADAGKLFIPFQRLPGVEEFKGSGIGLATVDRIIKRHGGKIWAESELGKGATFYFTLAAD